MHRLRIISFNKQRRPPITAQQLFQLVPPDPREHRRIGDLVTVQMQDREHRPIVHRMQKFIRMPRCRQRSCLRFPITHNTGDNKIGIIQHGAERMTERIAKLASFMDRPRTLRRYMARESRQGKKIE